jgi:NitT/TauT family transport system permease protein
MAEAAPGSAMGGERPAASLAPAAPAHSALDAFLPIGVALVALGAWEALVRALDVPQVLLPPPSRVLEVYAGADGARVLENALPTGVQAISGFMFATALGVLVAVAITYSQALKEAVHPYLVAFQVIPKIALAPLFVLWFGIGFASRFAFATFICFFPIVIALAVGLRDTHPDVIRMCRAAGASRAQILWQVRLPFALPYLFAGLKIAATMSIIGVVIGEFITADRGLGYLILFAASRSDTPLVMAAILLLCAIGLVLFGAVVLLERAVAQRQGTS